MTPFASSPPKQATIGLYFWKEDNPQTMQYIHFTPWGATRWLQVIEELHGEPVEYKHPDFFNASTLKYPTGWHVSQRDTRNMLLLADASLTHEQHKYQFHRSVLDQHPITRGATTKQQPSNHTSNTKQPKKPTTPKVTDPNIITVEQIAQELSIKPNKARAILRQKNIPKPSGGWQWAPDQVQHIKKVISNAK